MFLLCYSKGVPGLTYPAIKKMRRRERLWYLSRMAKQLKDEVAALKNAGKKKG